MTPLSVGLSPFLNLFRSAIGCVFGGSGRGAEASGGGRFTGRKRGWREHI